ncbi:4-hydroxybenzoate 3-monooxygenase [Raineyella sp.]|nr:4-hydroxybenzoate 3-monooxygenase [Raineyella sp.]MEA5153999.1 4-hydroxybenzoate 3-monooxygenase [Raineyella sp.]
MTEHTMTAHAQDREIVGTTVGIVGGGPAGLMLSHLLAREGVDNVVIDNRPHDTIATTHRAGILEAGSVRMLTETGAISRIPTEGYEHAGIYLRFNGENHHLDFKKLVGRTVWLYPQNDAFLDLAATRERDGGDVRFGVSDVTVEGIESDRPTIDFTDADGTPKRIECRIVVGADGSRSKCRDLVPGRVKHTMTYPFAWFGILARTPFQADELIYCHGESGFALISQRTPEIQRMYFQCDPSTKAADWTDEQIWDRFDEILDGPDGFRLQRGEIIEKTVLQFRSFVQEPMQHANLFLAGDAAHTVPPTGAKGLNLAFADVALLAPALVRWARTGDRSALDTYGERAAKRIWKAQNFSYWMTQMLHTHTDANSFTEKRQLGELMSVTSSPDSMKYLAECYTGWPYDLLGPEEPATGTGTLTAPESVGATR